MASVKSKYEGGDPEMDEKRKRNRESAKQYRLRKKKHVEDLTKEVNKLRSLNKELTESIKVKEEMCAEIEASNNILRTQFIVLVKRYRSLKMIELAEDLKNLPLQIPDLTS